MKHRKSRHDVSLEKSRSPDHVNITACSPDGKRGVGLYTIATSVNWAHKPLTIISLNSLFRDNNKKTEVIHDSDISTIIDTLRNNQYLKFVTMCMDHMEIRKLIMLRFGNYSNFSP